MKGAYQTEKGVDERVIPYPANYNDAQVNAMKEHGVYFTNWNDYYMMNGPGYTTKFLDDIKARLNDNRSAIIIVTGAPGEGKTYMAMRLGEMFDPKFDVVKQMCFTRIHVLKILSDEIKLERGQAFLMDESHMSGGSRSWGEADQKILVNLLATARSKGFLIIFIALHKNMLDLIIRKYLGSFMIGMEKPGLGTPYRLYIPRWEDKMWKNRYDQLEIALPDAELCNAPDCLACKFNDRCMTSRAVYERLKKTFLTDLSKAAADNLEAQMKKESTPSRKDIEKIIYAEHREEIVYNNRGKIDTKSIIRIADSLNWTIGATKAGQIADNLYMKHKDLRPK